MKVTLISHTPDAAALLIFTKNTRLQMSAGSLERVRAMSEAEKLKELKYMAETIPSSWEFVDYVFAIEGVSRAFTHQFVRTRTASFAQQSMRITDVSEAEFVMPHRLENTHAGSCMEQCVDEAMDNYRDLLELEIAPEDARAILPTNVATNIVAKFNLRSLADLVKSRSGGRTQSEYQDVVRAMASAVLDVHPWTAHFLFPAGRDHYAEIEAWAEERFGGDLKSKGELLKIVDRMRKEGK